MPTRGSVCKLQPVKDKYVMCTQNETEQPLQRPVRTIYGHDGTFHMLTNECTNKTMTV